MRIPFYDTIIASEAKSIGTTSLRISSSFARDKNHAVAASSRSKKTDLSFYQKRLILFYFYYIVDEPANPEMLKRSRTESSPPEAATAHGLPDRPADTREKLLSDEYLPKVCYRYAQSCFL